MTASLGTGGSNSRDLGDAIRYALEICANMDAKWISTVRRQLNNLRQYIPDVKEEIQFVEDQNQHLEFLRGKIVKQIEWQKSLMNQIPEGRIFCINYWEAKL
jgi:predicted transcriptional regulator YheO